MPALKRKIFLGRNEEDQPAKGGPRRAPKPPFGGGGGTPGRSGATGKGSERRAGQGNLSGGIRGQRDPNSGFAGRPPTLIDGQAGGRFFRGKPESSAERQERLDAQKARDKKRGVGKKRGGAGSSLLNNVSNKKTLLGGS